MSVEKSKKSLFERPFAFEKGDSVIRYRGYLPPDTPIGEVVRRSRRKDEYWDCRRNFYKVAYEKDVPVFIEEKNLDRIHLQPFGFEIGARVNIKNFFLAQVVGGNAIVVSRGREVTLHGSRKNGKDGRDADNVYTVELCETPFKVREFELEPVAPGQESDASFEYKFAVGDKVWIPTYPHLARYLAGKIGEILSRRIILVGETVLGSYQVKFSNQDLSTSGSWQYRQNGVYDLVESDLAKIEPSSPAASSKPRGHPGAPTPSRA